MNRVCQVASIDSYKSRLCDVSNRIGGYIQNNWMKKSWKRGWASRRVQIVAVRQKIIEESYGMSWEKDHPIVEHFAKILDFCILQKHSNWEMFDKSLAEIWASISSLHP